MTARLIESSFNFIQLDVSSSYPVKLTCLPETEKTIHSIILNNVEYQMEIKKTLFINEKIILIHGYLANSSEFGLVTFELTL